MYRFAIALLVAFHFGCGSTGAEDLVLMAAKAYTAHGPAIEPAVIVIRDGKIAELGAKIELPAGAHVVDLGDAVLVPGFVNAYSQMGISGGSSELTRELTPDFEVLAAIDWESRAFREAVDEGVTTVGISPGTDNVVAGIALAAKTHGKELRRRVLRPNAGLVMTLASDPRSRNRSRSRPDSIYVRQPTNRMGVVWMLRRAIQGARRDESASGVLAEALQGERRIYCVSRTHFDIETIARVAEEFDFAPVIVGGEESHRLAELLATRKLPVILGPLRTSVAAGTEQTDPVWNRAGVLRQAGVQIAMSGPSLLEQARFAVRFGLAADDALRAITCVPAGILGIDERVGTLQAGRDADVVVLDGDPFEFTTNVQAVIIGGAFVVPPDRRTREPGEANQTVGRHAAGSQSRPAPQRTQSGPNSP